jgi:hypothetical protein
MSLTSGVLIAELQFEAAGCRLLMRVQSQSHVTFSNAEESGQLGKSLGLKIRDQFFLYVKELASICIWEVAQDCGQLD